MPYPDDPGDLLVSLQDRARGIDAPSGHVALGVLVEPSRVVFQVPPDFALAPDAQLEVLLAPTGVSEAATVVERIKPQRLWISSLAPSERPQAATALLSQPSDYGTGPSTIDEDTLVAALERAGDIWTALVGLGIVAGPLLDLDPSDALRRIARIEEVQRRVLVSNAVGKDPRVIGNCIFSSSCHPWKPRI